MFLNTCHDFNIFKPAMELSVQPGSTFKNSTCRLYSVYDFTEKTVTFALHNINNLDFMTEFERVYSAVRTDSLYKTYVSSLKG